MCMIVMDSSLSLEGSECSPQAPLSFHVEKALGHNGLLVAWQPPPMDSMCHSNGCLVTGYQVYVNGQTKSLVSGASQSRVSVLYCCVISLADWSMLSATDPPQWNLTH